MSGIAKRSSIVTIGAFLFGLAGPASADLEIAAGGGVFGPYEGSSGYVVFGQIMGSTQSGYWRFGGEFN